MGTPIAPLKININDKIKDMFIVKKKIGEGACGQIFLVNKVDKTGKVLCRAAMKVESLMKCKDDEILKMEIFVLKNVQKSRNVCRFLASGKTATYTFMVMSLLGKEITEIRRRLPGRKMSTNSTIRIFIQTIKALQDIHEAGFVHRDVKPSNIAMGPAEMHHTVFVFDFGLARQILTKNKNGTKTLREPRHKVMFRGTVRYCSLNVHQHKEQGRHDDLYGALYGMIETTTGQLPWKGKDRKEAFKIKEKVTEEKVCAGCPGSFLEIAKMLKKCTYKDEPSYKKMQALLSKDLPPNMKMMDDFEWSNDKKIVDSAETANKSDREAPEKDKGGADTSTVNEVDESVVTEDRKTDGGANDNDFSQENTLEGVPGDNSQYN